MKYCIFVATLSVLNLTSLSIASANDDGSSYALKHMIKEIDGNPKETKLWYPRESNLASLVAVSRPYLFYIKKSHPVPPAPGFIGARGRREEQDDVASVDWDHEDFLKPRDDWKRSDVMVFKDGFLGARG